MKLALVAFVTFGPTLLAQPVREIAVPFNDGFIGKRGNNAQDADSVQTFQTLGISRAFFVQQSSTGFFSAQGNDIFLTLRLQMASGNIIEIDGALVWRETSSGNTLEIFGFLAGPSINLNLNSYGGADYEIVGGLESGKSNFGMKRIGATIQFFNNETVTGNAATSGLLDALNAYLQEINSLRPIGPVGVEIKSICSTNPQVSGNATLAAGESLSVQVNGKTYDSNSGLAITGTTWNLEIPTNNPVASNNIYSVVATITNAGGYTLSDSTYNELTLTDPCPLDSDGDGVPDDQEIADGTDPNDSCDLKLASQTLTPSQAWESGDCDGDGVTNQKENQDGTDFKDSCDLTLASQTLTPSQTWNGSDCDGDGVTNQKEKQDGTDFKDSCDLTLASQTLTPSQAWNGGDCDGDGVTNQKEKQDGTDFKDSCDLTLASQTLTPSQAWNDGDCDGDGVTNQKEKQDGTDFKDSCDLALASQTLTPSQSWNDGDCDGDGNKNQNDPDPNDPCNYAPGTTINTQNPIWQAADCDGDGVINGKEILDGTDPNDFCDLTIASQTLSPSHIWDNADCDGDGVSNSKEKLDGTEFNDSCDFELASQTLLTSLEWNTADCDDDGVTNQKEKQDGTDPNNSCDLKTASQTLSTGQGWNDADCDGDGVTNQKEKQDGTDLNNSCDLKTTSQTLPTGQAWNDADCDGDGVTNQKEKQDGTDPNNSCDLKTASQTLSTSQAWENADCDGDGVTNKKEKQDGTDPSNSCSLIIASQTANASQAWKDGDCDGDGSSNSNDPNPANPVAEDDQAETDEGVSVEIDLLENDDFKPGANVEITRNGGSAKGTFTIDNSTGKLSYRPAPGETGPVTFIYEVCNKADGATICDQATVTIDITPSPTVVVPQGIIPNGNGKNDVWVIRGLDKYPANKISVFNRWGNRVFSSSPYENNWDGSSNSEGVVGTAKVPAGIYYYILQLGNGKEISGFLTVAY